MRKITKEFTNYQGNVICTEAFSVDTNLDLLEQLVGVKEQLVSTFVDLTGTALESDLAGHELDKFKQLRVLNLSCDKGGDWSFTKEVKNLSSNLASRFIGVDEQTYYSEIEIPVQDFVVKALVRRFYNNMKDEALMYVEFAGENKDDAEQQASHIRSKNMIMKGFNAVGRDGLTRRYEYVESSASQQRTLKGVFIDSQYKTSEEYTNSFEPTYGTFLTELKGADALLEAITYGAYSSEQFSDMYNNWKLAGSLEATGEGSVAKFLTRTGTSLTTSKPLGKDWKVLTIGEVHFPWTENVENSFRAMMYTDSKGTHPVYTDKDIEELKASWKTQKLDGQTIIQLEKFCKEYCKANPRVSFKQAKKMFKGQLVQYRWAGIKGTGLLMPKSVINSVKDKNGVHIYKDFQIICEGASWKYSPRAKFSYIENGAVVENQDVKYVGDNAPEFCLVSYSKHVKSNSMNAQFWLALDGVSTDKAMLERNVTSLVDEHYDRLKSALVNPDYAKELLGVRESKSLADYDFIDETELMLKTKLARAIDKLPAIVHEPYFRAKFLETFGIKIEKDFKAGKIPVSGANRFIISDPTAMLRTDLMDDNGDITITSPEQVALGNMHHSFWKGESCDAIIFRSPCVSSGEPTKVELVGLDAIPEEIQCNGFVIKAKELFADYNNLFVLNGFCSTLEALGGADTDGDTVLIVTDPRVVALRSPKRKITIISLEGKTAKNKLSKAGVRKYVADSLKDNGIGIITNWAMTWRDIQIHVAYGNKIVSDAMYNTLSRTKDSASNVLASNPTLSGLNIYEQEAVKAISGMDLNKVMSVYNACECALKCLRALQEMAINTAKSGIFIDLEEYEYLKHFARPMWLKEDAKEEKMFDSNSTMHVIFERSQDKLDEIFEECITSAKDLDLDCDEVVLMEIEDTIADVESYYATKVRELTMSLGDIKDEDRRKDAFNMEFERLTAECNSKLNALVMSYGLEVVVVGAYQASISTENETGANRRSFLWNCFFEEFIAYLDMQRAKQEENVKAMPVRLSYSIREDVDSIDTIVAPVEVKGGTIMVEDKEVGKTDVVDGFYELSETISGKQYLIVPFEYTAKERMASFKGMISSIVGFKQNDLTGGKASKMVEFCNNIVEFRALDIDEHNNTRVGAFLVSPKTGDAKRIGTLPYNDKAINKAYINKKFKVNVLADSVRDSSFKFEIVEFVSEI